MEQPHAQEDAEKEIGRAVLHAREELRAEVGIPPWVDVSGPRFVEYLPELVGHSTRLRLEVIRRDVARDAELSRNLLIETRYLRRATYALLASTAFLAVVAVLVLLAST